MTDAVVDSCVAAKWVLPEADSAQALRVVTDVVPAGARLVVLDLVFAEVGNAIWKRLHRGLISATEARRCLDELTRSPVHVESATRLLRPAFEIAARYGRSVYDALFVALAHDLNLPGVTADEPLYHAVHADFPRVVLLRDWSAPPPPGGKPIP
jgi:predicted nucleic acid-binding protein